MYCFARVCSKQKSRISLKLKVVGTSFQSFHASSVYISAVEMEYDPTLFEWVRTTTETDGKQVVYVLNPVTLDWDRQ